MSHLSDKLIEFIVADYYEGDMAKCIKFHGTHLVHKQTAADVLSTFKEFGYEMAKGVFINETFK